MNDDRGFRYTPDDRSVLVSHGERLIVVENNIRRLEMDLDNLRQEAVRLRASDQALLEPIYQLHAWGKQTGGFIRVVGSVAALITGVYGLVKLMGWA